VNVQYVKRIGYWSIAAAVLWTAGCAGSAVPAVAPGAGRLPVTAPLASTQGSLIYSGDFANSTITIYPAKGVDPQPIGTITDGISAPERLFVDKNQNLYVSNHASITVYAKGATQPSLTITTGINRPTGIVTGSDGKVYVGNAGTNDVTVYDAGKKSPSKTIAMPTNDQPQNLALDAANNLYALYLAPGSPGSGIVKFAPGSNTGKDLGITVGWPSAIELDRKDNLIALVGGASIEVFPPGQTKPSHTWTLPHSGSFLSFSQDEEKLYVSESLGWPSNRWIIQQLDYPNGIQLTNKILDGTFANNSWALAASPDNVL